MLRRFMLLWMFLALTPSAWVRGDEPAKDAVVATVSGRVLVDSNRNGEVDAEDKGLAGVWVTDGVQFVQTDEKGGFTIKIADDPLLPYKPSQVVSVCWPTGTWPVGQRYFARRADIKPGQSVDFLLREQKQKLPFTFAHGTDPHDNLGCANGGFGDDIRRMGDSVQFCLMTGDLGYADWDSAEAMFTQIRNATQRFPIPMLHTCGNHDIVGIHSTRWSEQSPLAGFGPYTKYLGPLRYSFDYAGIHFVGLDWSRILEDGKMQTGVYDTVIDWLKKDLGHQKPGTRSIVYIHHHFRHGDDKFFEALAEHKVELVLAGHSHRNKEDTHRGVKWLTTQNLCGPYRLVTVNEKGTDIVNRCYTGSESGHAHAYAGKCKMIDAANVKAKRGAHHDVAKLDLNSAKAVDGFQAKQFEVIAEIDPGAAEKVGLRFGLAGAKTEIAIQCATDELRIGDIKTPTVRARGDKNYRLRLIVVEGKALVFVNNRVQFEYPVSTAQAAGVEFFADGGRAAVNKADVWELNGER